MAITVVLMIWPVFIIFFVYKNKLNLEEKKFLEKFNSMYLGNKTTKVSTACYHAVFCVRRLCIALTYIAFRTN